MIKVHISLLLSISLVLGQLFSYPVLADEYTIEGNGEGSANQINIQQQEDKTVSQNNQAEVENKVKSEVTTGDNQASGNNGETEIETGDVSSDTTVLNQGNTNNAQSGCCSTDNSASVSGNGSGSDNQINSAQSNNTTVSQNNHATITNNITVNANAGDNEASENNGNSTIKTGDVTVNTGVYNYGNTSHAKISSAALGFDLKIAGNGEGSTNDINNEFQSTQIVYVSNVLDLKNNVKHYANTGGNKAYKNLGDVKIITGDVYLDIILSNKFNTSVVEADCGCKSQPSPTPTPSGSPTPSTRPSGGENGGGGGGGGSSSGGSGGSDSSSAGQGGGQVLGATLPATGGFSVFSLTLLAFSLLLAGIMARIDFRKNYEEAKSYIQFINYGFTAPAVIYILAFCKSLSLSRQANFARGQSLYIYPQDISLRTAY